MSSRIQFAFRAQVLDFVSDEPVELKVKDLSIGDDKMENYLSRELADCGIVGGEVSLTAVRAGAVVTVVYWSPKALDDSVIGRLLSDTLVQIQDGMGEGGFAFHYDGRLLVACVDLDTQPMRTIAEDRREVLPPPLAAVSARDGDLAQLQAALESEPDRIDAPFQGYCALHYAILAAEPTLARLLIEAGADVNLLDASGDSPLLLCAKAEKLDDEHAEVIAKLLLGSGARIQLRDGSGQTAKYYALLRGKQRLARLLD